MNQRNVSFLTELESNTETYLSKQHKLVGIYSQIHLNFIDRNPKSMVLYFVNSKAINLKGTSQSTCSFGKAHLFGEDSLLCSLQLMRHSQVYRGVLLKSDFYPDIYF